MKRKSIISLLVCSMMVGMFTTSCKDMLTPDSERHSYEVAKDTLYSYWGILKSLQNVAERYVILNECRGDLISGTEYVSDTINSILNFGRGEFAEKYKDGQFAYLRISDYYHIINSCNAYIANCDLSKKTGTNKPYMAKECAQVMAIRAWVYMQLVYAYGEVPFYTTPLLTTDDINNFMSDPNQQKANIYNLADLLAPSLEPMYDIEYEFGFPQYNNYGDVNTNSNYVCHSSKAMFPVAVVLGDLYLMKGDKASCQKAAEWYYRYINTKVCGPLNAYNYICTADVVDGQDDPIYDFSGNPYRETGAVSVTTEAVTCIPSNKSKLDGKVNTDLNRLFGFTPTLYASGSGDDSYSSISLSLNYERELGPSRGYEALCDAQDYEIYIGSEANPFEKLEVMPGVGDARRVWTLNTAGSGQYIFYVGENRYYGKLVGKQNPNRSYSTAYPVVYRKSTIWLHYAEALNRAGFPSYAFAVLKNGLCNNETWFPELDAETADGEWLTYDAQSNPYTTSYAVKEANYCYILDTNAEDGTPIYFNPETESKTSAEPYAYTSMAEMGAAVVTFLADVEEHNTGLDPDDAESGYINIPTTYNSYNIRWKTVSYQNYTNPTSSAVCYYIDRRERKVAQNYEFLDFNRQYLRGRYITVPVPWKSDMTARSSHADAYRVPNGSLEDYVTIGIHQRGCGILRTDDPDRMTRYNYVNMVAKTLKANYGKDITKEQIYDEMYLSDVQKAVEDLIIDEAALELAFEGSRFSDLCRVAKRRMQEDPTKGAEYLAERVAKRSGTKDNSLFTHLKQEKNWYLPFPEE